MTRDVLADPRLPHLATLIAPESMSRVLEAHFRERYPDRGLAVQGSSVEKVYYRPRKHGSALHRLRFRDRHGREGQHWFFARHFPAGEGSPRFEKALRKACPPVSFWQPVGFLPDLEMLVWAFPHDPRLHQLPELMRPETVTKLVEENAAALSLPPGTRCRAVHSRQVKYMPRKRCVLRFEVDLATPSGPRTLGFYSKTYGTAKSRYVYESMERAREALAAQPGPLEIPRSTLHLDSLHTYWQEEWPGESLSRLYGTAGLEHALPRVAGALAALHRMSVPGLKEAAYVERTAASAREDAGRIGRILPRYAERLEALADRLLGSEAALPGAGSYPAVPLHGAFRMSQLLGRGDRVAMTDFDAVALGDPHYDVAEFASSLLYQRFRRNLPLRDLETLSGVFVRAYDASVPWTLDGRRQAWFTAAFLLEKLHGTLKGLETVIFPHIDGVLELVDRKLLEAGA